MNINTGAIKVFGNSESIPKGYSSLSKKSVEILDRFSRKERRHLWSVYQILKVSSKMTFSDFVESLHLTYGE